MLISWTRCVKGENYFLNNFLWFFLRFCGFSCYLGLVVFTSNDKQSRCFFCNFKAVLDQNDPLHPFLHFHKFANEFSHSHEFTKEKKANSRIHELKWGALFNHGIISSSYGQTTTTGVDVYAYSKVMNNCGGTYDEHKLYKKLCCMKLPAPSFRTIGWVCNDSTMTADNAMTEDNAVTSEGNGATKPTPGPNV